MEHGVQDGQRTELVFLDPGEYTIVAKASEVAFGDQEQAPQEIGSVVYNLTVSAEGEPVGGGCAVGGTSGGFGLMVLLGLALLRRRKARR